MGRAKGNNDKVQLKISVMALERKQKLFIGLRKNTNVKSAGYNKYYGTVVLREGLTQRGFIKHVTAHIPGITESMTAAVLETVVKCIPELVAQGVSVKLNGIGIFYPTIANPKGGQTLAEMKAAAPSATTVVNGLRLRFRPDSTKLDNLTSKALRDKTAISLAGIYTSVTAGDKQVEVLLPMDEYKRAQG